MKNLAVFSSGFGSNLQAIINAVKKGKVKVNIALVLSDKVDAYSLVRAKKAGIKFLYVDPALFLDRISYDKFIMRCLRKEKIDYIVLAGFMRIISDYFIKQYKNKIINIHPSLLPSFKGKQAILDALDYGVKCTGVTVHFVTSTLDGGPVIFQAALNIKDDESLESLSIRIHRLEHKLYLKAIDKLVKGKLVLRGRKVVVK
ncbi:MAG: phosphoribosylglycinamide formyltransferase [Candidatus Omnitrophica bacterium]|nr:phosphoribosylglycinamide formyltransferase [Candidatus Omnitrophota bacterium]